MPGAIHDKMRDLQRAGMYKVNPSQLLQAALLARFAEIEANENAIIRQPH